MVIHHCYPVPVVSTRVSNFILEWKPLNTDLMSLRDKKVYAILKCHRDPKGSGVILFMRPANERRRYIVTSSLIGWAQTGVTGY